MTDLTNTHVIRLVVVDDDPFICDSLRTILDAQPDITVVGIGHDSDSAVDLWRDHRPDILLTDIRMAGASGLDAATTILQEDPQARIVLLTTFADDEYIVSALRLGVAGYLIKQDVATIAPSLRLVMAGQSVLGSEVLGRVDRLLGAQADRRKTPSGTDQAVGTAPLASGNPLTPSPSPTSLTPSPSAAPLTPRQTATSSTTTNTPPLISPALSGLTKREQEVAELVADGLDNRQIAATLFISEGTARNLVSMILQKTGLKNRTQLAVAHYRA